MKLRLAGTISITVIVICVALYMILKSGEVQAQPYGIGHMKTTFIDSTRKNREITAEIYYPADSSGDLVPFSRHMSGKAPVLSFGHGFVMRWDAYENIWQAVVPEGYVIVFPTTESSFSPSHEELGSDMVFLLRQLQQLGKTKSSIFYEHIDTMNCIMGHSMGGGSAFLAAAANTDVKAMVTFAPAETRPSAIKAAAKINIPALIFAGSNDCITPEQSNQLPMYENLASPGKLYIIIKGGSHCLMAATSFTCGFGEATCKPKPEITREEQHRIINRYLIPWLNCNLKKQEGAGNSIDQLLAKDSSVTYKKGKTTGR